MPLDNNSKRTTSSHMSFPTEYAQVIKMLGNGRLEAMCFDGVKRLGLIRGKLRKKIWINNGDIILVSLREYQDEKGDVILKYSADEARSLYVFLFSFPLSVLSTTVLLTTCFPHQQEGLRRASRHRQDQRDRHLRPQRRRRLRLRVRRGP
ncbi:eukaryotic translation initiation factor 1A, X-chromosomal [Neurospora hispaniola]|uniref:Eukaryotic translation initiation factor 1A, X-chromosomal n=1 Tax=Neurospora hispaniola TaxID=588809 RepID=A0AAJ0MPU3_9PEZI|nr:eukaryotic translation initiation factor 1A, X-chromosomal [Neurospora hispaniola]